MPKTTNIRVGIFKTVSQLATTIRASTADVAKKNVILPHQRPTLLFYHIILQHLIYQIFYHSILYIKIIVTTH